MAPPSNKHRSAIASHEGGFALVEVIMSAVLVMIIAGGALMAILASSRTAAEERHRAQAHGIAQEDQSRMRALRIADLSNLSTTRTVTTKDGNYTVESRADFVTDSTGTASCEQGTASPDYIRVSSKVTWPSMGARPPVVLQSIVAPPNGSIAEDRGALAVSVKGGLDQPIPDVVLNGSGTASFSGATSENGCIIFGNLPAGNYTLTPVAPGYVDHDGNEPAPLATSVVAQSTNTVVFQLDEPGSIRVEFTTMIDDALFASSAESVIAFNTGMTRAQAYSDGSRSAAIVASPLFPFASPDTVYAGSCTANNPNPTSAPDAPGAPATDSVMVNAGEVAQASVQLPALNLLVFDGSGQANAGAPVQGARVVLTDTDCAAEGEDVVYERETDANGTLTDPGLPWSTYDVCVETGGSVATATGVEVKDLEVGADLTFYMGSASAGVCG